ncbi:MAG: riboflavin kinase, partial [Wenzhouxiangellaceae bacterium]|nr:riboflavin kinase [Wenzhouxiangellaceae bacterium]
MRLIRHLPHSAPARPTAVAIGNFDGLHRGHRALVEACTARAPELAPAMLCFEPLPRTFFAPERPVPRVMKLRDRVRVASALGVELLAVLRFDRAFSMRSPAGFARDVLAAGLSARRVVVGEDFRFGHRAAGDVDALRQFGRELGFDVEAIPPVVDADGRRISSTRLRAALAEGDLDRAAALLGRRYRISGRVLRGKSLGRDLGFPTVNLRVAEPPALTGICAVRVHGAGLQ